MADKSTVKLCPFRTQTTIFHNDRRNYMIPSHGINKKMDYDVVIEDMLPCIKEKCALYDSKSKKCSYSVK